MTRSAQQILTDAGVNIPTWDERLQIAKIHGDLAYMLTTFDNATCATIATADGRATCEWFDGAHATRKARGWINRLKRGETRLEVTT